MNADADHGPMGGPDDEAEMERQAREHVSALRGFYRHLAAYVAVNLLLLAINLVTAPDKLWFYWPLLGWGIGLSAHAIRTFAMPSFDRDWEERKVAEYKERARARRSSGR